MPYAVALKDFICKFCHEAAKSTAAKPVACQKRECQTKRQAHKGKKPHKPRASTAKAPDPAGSYKRHGAIWAELDALIAQDGREP